MPIPYGPLALSAGETITETTVQYPTANQAVILNMSPYTLRLNPYTGSYPIVAPNTQDLVMLGNQYSGHLDITAQSDLSTAAEAPAFVVYVMVYAAGEQVQGVYPALVPVVTVGGGTLSGGGVASSVVQDGTAGTSNVVEATPTGAASSNLLWRANGSGLFGGGFWSVDSSGQLTWTAPPSFSSFVNLFTFDNTTNAGGHKILWQWTGSNGLALMDFTAAINWLSFTAALIQLGVNMTVGTTTGNIATNGSLSADAGQFHTDGSGNLSMLIATIQGPDILRTGNQLTTIGGGAFHVVNTTTDVAVVIAFSPNLTNAPTGISDTIIASTQETGLGFASFLKYGCDMFWKGTVATSNTEVIATVVTQGN